MFVLEDNKLFDLLFVISFVIVCSKLCCIQDLLDDLILI